MSLPFDINSSESELRFLFDTAFADTRNKLYSQDANEWHENCGKGLIGEV
jgi:hypothetical protein